MDYPALITAISDAHRQAQAGAAGAVNRHLVFRNWLIGAYLVEFEQSGEDWQRRIPTSATNTTPSTWWSTIGFSAATSSSTLKILPVRRRHARGGSGVEGDGAALRGAEEIPRTETLCLEENALELG